MGGGVLGTMRVLRYRNHLTLVLLPRLLFSCWQLKYTVNLPLTHMDCGIRRFTVTGLQPIILAIWEKSMQIIGVFVSEFITICMLQMYDLLRTNTTKIGVSLNTTPLHFDLSQKETGYSKIQSVARTSV